MFTTSIREISTHKVIFILEEIITIIHFFTLDDFVFKELSKFLNLQAPKCL